MIKSTLFYTLLNFGALAIGGLATAKGVSGWYRTLEIAPWTPPSWFFGFAWTTIMVLMTISCVRTIPLSNFYTPFFGIYFIHLLLNVAWNYVFFYFQNPFLGMVELGAFNLVLWWMYIQFGTADKWNYVLLLPYVIWGAVAMSLNVFIYLKN